MLVDQPNRMIQQTVWNFDNGGWPIEVASGVPHLEDGHEGVGFDMELLPAVAKRPDAVIRRISEKCSG